METFRNCPFCGSSAPTEREKRLEEVIQAIVNHDKIIIPPEITKLIEEITPCQPLA